MLSVYQPMYSLSHCEIDFTQEIGLWQHMIGKKDIPCLVINCLLTSFQAQNTEIRYTAGPFYVIVHQIVYKLITFQNSFFPSR